MHLTWNTGDPVIQLNFPNPLNVSVQVGDIAYFSNPTEVGQAQEWAATTTPHLANPQSGIIMIGEIIQIIPWNGIVSSIICNMPQDLFNQYFEQIIAGGCITTPDPYTGNKTLMAPTYDVDAGLGPALQADGSPNGNQNAWFQWATSCTSSNTSGHIKPHHIRFNYNSVHGHPDCSYPALGAINDNSTYLQKLPHWSPPLKFFFEPGNEHLRFDDYMYINHAKQANGILHEPHLMYTSYYTVGNTPGWAAAWPGDGPQTGNFPYANLKFYTQHEIIAAAINDFTVDNGFWTTATFGNGDSNFIQAPYHGMTWEEWMFHQTVIIPYGSSSGWHSPLLWGWVEEEAAITSTTTCTQGSFIMFSKDNKVNMSDMLGYYASVELRNSSTTEAELFNVGTTFFESSK